MMHTDPVTLEWYRRDCSVLTTEKLRQQNRRFAAQLAAMETEENEK